MQALASEVAADLNRWLAPPAEDVRIHASHGYAVAALVTALVADEVPLDIKYRDSTGTERAPRRLSSSSPAGSSSTLMDWNSIARTERNSLSFRQLVHPGCQNTFRGMALMRCSPYAAGGRFVRAWRRVNRLG